MESGGVLGLIYQALQEVNGKPGFGDLVSVTIDGGRDCSLCITVKDFRKKTEQCWFIESHNVKEG